MFDRFAARPPSKESVAFGHAIARLMIGSLDDPDLTVTAHYNPHEISIKKSVPWNAKPAHGGPAKPKQNGGDSHELTGSPTRAMSLELLFDGYEDKMPVDMIVDMLEEMSTVRDPFATEEELRRTHYCVVTWGEQGMRPFRCVITSLNVRYTMFASDGTPLRAVCSVELSEAQLSGPGSITASGSASGSAGGAPARATKARP